MANTVVPFQRGQPIDPPSGVHKRVPPAQAVGSGERAVPPLAVLDGCVRRCVDAALEAYTAAQEEGADVIALREAGRRCAEMVTEVFEEIDAL